MAVRDGDFRELDLRSASPSERLASLQTALRSARPGGAFVVVSDEELEDTFEALTHERPGLLRWSSLASEGPPFRYGVSVPVPPVGDAMLRFLEWQDEVLDDRLDEVDEIASDGLAEAIPTARSFELALAQHADVEERMLFPLLARFCADPDSVPRVRAQHEALRRLAADVTAALEERDSKRFVAAMDALQSALAAHHWLEQTLMEEIPL